MSQVVGQIVVTVTAHVEVPPLLRLRAKIANVLVAVAKWLVECKVTVNVTSDVRYGTTENKETQTNSIHRLRRMNKLDELVNAAKKIKMSPEDRERQRRSFAYGNVALSNSRVTREIVDRQAEKLAQNETR